MRCLLLALLGVGVLRAEWRAEQVAVVEGFEIPESVVADAENGRAVVSNVVGSPWQRDHNGYLSVIAPAGTVTVKDWGVKSEPHRLCGPKGMALAHGFLWVADVDRVRRYSLDGKQVRTASLRGQRLNDVASDGQTVYVSDTAAGKVYALDKEGQARSIPAPRGVNGLTAHEGKLYAVTWMQADLYELDPAGRRAPKAFGLAPHFRALDGIEVLADGSFVVSDHVAGRVLVVSPDRKSVSELLRAKTPADIGLDRQRQLLYVPEFTTGRVLVFKLSH